MKKVENVAIYGSDTKSKQYGLYLLASDAKHGKNTFNC
jgi:hypothetical protein